LARSAIEGPGTQRTAATDDRSIGMCRQVQARIATAATEAPARLAGGPRRGHAI